MRSSRIVTFKIFISRTSVKENRFTSINFQPEEQT